MASRRNKKRPETVAGNTLELDWVRGRPQSQAPSPSRRRRTNSLSRLAHSNTAIQKSDVRAGHRRVTFQVDAKLIEAWGMRAPLAEMSLQDERLRGFDFASFADELKANLCVREWTDGSAGDVDPAGLARCTPYAVNGVWMGLARAMEQQPEIGAAGPDASWPIMEQCLVRAMVGDRRLEIEVLEQIEKKISTTDPKHPGWHAVQETELARFQLFKSLAWRARRWLSKHGFLAEAVVLDKDLPALLEVKVVMLGSAGVGKTTSACGYMKGVDPDPAHVEPMTVSTDFFTKTIEVPHNFVLWGSAAETTKIRATIFDTAGQEIYHSIIPNIVANADVVVVVQAGDTQTTIQPVLPTNSTSTSTSSTSSTDKGGGEPMAGPVATADSDGFLADPDDPAEVQIPVGPSTVARKTVPLPRAGLKVEPARPMPHGETFAFTPVGDDALEVRRTDTDAGWAQDLVLRGVDCSDCFCGLCGELMCEPVLANPCAHRFCKPCLAEWHGAGTGVDHGYAGWLSASCPTCRCRLEGPAAQTVHGATLAKVVRYFSTLYAAVITVDSSARTKSRLAVVKARKRTDHTLVSCGTEDNFLYWAQFARFHSRRPDDNPIPVVRYRNKTDLELLQQKPHPPPSQPVAARRASSRESQMSQMSHISRISTQVDGEDFDLFEEEFVLLTRMRSSRDPFYELPPLTESHGSISVKDTLLNDLASGHAVVPSAALGEPYSHFWGSARTVGGGLDEMFERAITLAAARKYRAFGWAAKQTDTVRLGGTSSSRRWCSSSACQRFEHSTAGGKI